MVCPSRSPTFVFILSSLDRFQAVSVAQKQLPAFAWRSRNLPQLQFLHRSSFSKINFILASRIFPKLFWPVQKLFALLSVYPIKNLCGWSNHGTHLKNTLFLKILVLIWITGFNWWISRKSLVQVGFLQGWVIHAITLIFGLGPKTYKLWIFGNTPKFSETQLVHPLNPFQSKPYDMVHIRPDLKFNPSYK